MEEKEIFRDLVIEIGDLFKKYNIDILYTTEEKTRISALKDAWKYYTALQKAEIEAIDSAINFATVEDSRFDGIIYQLMNLRHKKYCDLDKLKDVDTTLEDKLKWYKPSEEEREGKEE